MSTSETRDRDSSSRGSSLSGKLKSMPGSFRRFQEARPGSLRRYLVLLFLIPLGYLSQVCIIPYFSLGGVTPNLLFAVIGIITVAYGRVQALWAGLFYGLLLEILLPMDRPLTTQPLMELMFAVGLPAVGSALLFNLDASSGGTDIVAMILRKYTSLNIGIALLCSDTVITLAACAAFGMETGLFSVLGLIIKSLFIDVVADNLRIQKCFHIITSHPEKLEKFITEDLHRGATRLQGEGVYTHDGKTILLTAVSRHQAVLLRNYIHQEDPEAFLIITTSTEIIGKGFRGVN